MRGEKKGILDENCADEYIWLPSEIFNGINLVQNVEGRGKRIFRTPLKSVVDYRNDDEEDEEEGGEEEEEEMNVPDSTATYRARTFPYRASIIYSAIVETPSLSMCIARRFPRY